MKLCNLALALVPMGQLSAALVSDVPSLNAAVPYVPYTAGQKSRPSEFVHPGLWHSHSDLEAIRTGVSEGLEPWASAYSHFANDSFSLATYEMQGPHAVISRGGVSNYTSFANDARAAYQNAIMWYVTNSSAHWERSTTILDAWGSNLTSIIGTDRSLLIGLEGDMFVNAAEIMRWEGGWREAGASWKGGQGFSVQLYWLFARQSIVIGQANYGIASIKGLMDFAVYLEDVDMYNYALWMYKNDKCASVRSVVEPRTGQNSEAGRDQGHAIVGLAWLALASRTARNQGYAPLYREGGDLLTKGSEYVAKYNLGHDDVPYSADWRRCEAVLVDGPWDHVATENRGVVDVVGSDGKTGMSKPVWDILHYSAERYGVRDPWTAEAKELYDAHGGDLRPTTNDMPGWGDLLWANKAVKK